MEQLDQAVVRVLGGSAVLGSRPRSTEDWIAVIRKGLPVETLRALERYLGSFEAVARVSSLDRRTLQRRKQHRAKLTSQESERLMRLARVIAHAESVFGDKQKAMEWLSRKSRVLGQRPFDLLDTDLGTQSVIDELVRIAYGVYA
jgi:putative toxin-antitoxin system antitoxin component (TIGR02293 family)